jgi:hypothetical protein
MGRDTDGQRHRWAETLLARVDQRKLRVQRNEERFMLEITDEARGETVKGSLDAIGV